MATVLITGGTGMIGRALTKALLENNYHIIILSRNPVNAQRTTANLSYAQWNINKQEIDKEAIAQADYIIHLAGAGVTEKRWTKKRKQEIVDSRVKSGELLVKALKESNNHVKAILSSSGIGWYGPDPVVPNLHPFTEDDPPAKDFLGTICRQWEQSLQPVFALGKRLVIFRTGIVIGEGGAMKEFERPMKFGVAAILGNGKQIISWIHIDDLVRLYLAAIVNESMTGVYNAVAPNPVSNRDFTLQLAKAKRGKFFIPVYMLSFILKIVFGEMSIEALKSATVSCAKIHYSGFDFLYSSVGAAFRKTYSGERE